MRDLNLILVTLYWPLLDVLVWGFLGTWIAQSIPNYAPVALLGILLWQLSCRTTITIFSSFMEELWANNLTNLFALPLRLSEWITGVIIFSIILVTVIAFYCIGLIWLMYQLALAKIMLAFLIFGPPLFICGIWLGFMGLQPVAMFGKRVQELGFIIGWFFAPFSGAFYPIDALPHWAKLISYFLPMSYILEGMRNYMLYDTNPAAYLVKGYALAILYAIISIVTFIYAFNKSKAKGLTRLSD